MSLGGWLTTDPRTSQPIPRPTDLRDYAKGQGWRIADWGKEKGLFVLYNEAFEYRQLIIPMHETDPGYAESALAFVEKLADLTRQSPQRVTDQILEMSRGIETI